MKIIFWGVRGSIPSPLTPRQVQAKISAVVQRITPKDIESSDARERFVSSLPYWIYGTAGGNTPCLEIKTESGLSLILDCGSGLRMLGKYSEKPSDKHYHVFFSHFHWDHLQGLPFFDAAYERDSVFDVYSTFPAAERLLRKQMEHPYFPVTFDAFTKNFNFHTIKAGTTFTLGDITISCCKMSHPGNSYSYSFTENGKKFVYATDVEITQKDFEWTEGRAAVFQDADAIVLDAQYTVAEVYQKENWGHSAFCHAIDFAVHWNAKSIYLFHHEPMYDDKKLNTILQSAAMYAKYTDHPDIKIYLAMENMTVKL